MNKIELLPGDTSPAEAALKLVRRFLAEPVPPEKHYKEACVWYGALTAAAVLNEEKLLAELSEKYRVFEGSYEGLLSGRGHVDNNVFGIVPLEIALRTGDAFCRDEGLAIAEHQYRNIEAQIRYAIDDMFMITALQLQAFRVSGEEKYKTLAAQTMESYLDELQQEDGLFVHHRDFPHRWCRGNGWVAAGMAEMITDLSEDHPSLERIRNGYTRMMKALLEHQIIEGEGKGLWRQIVNSRDQRNWAETSGSAMFCYALITGLRTGLLDMDIYAPAARRAWSALTRSFTDDGLLKNVSKWAYKPESHPESGERYTGDEENYYFERERLSGDNHGQAPMLWSAAALL